MQVIKDRQTVTIVQEKIQTLESEFKKLVVVHICFLMKR